MTSEKIGEHGTSRYEQEKPRPRIVNGDLPTNGRSSAHGPSGEHTTDYRRLFENAPVGYFIITEDGMITQANPTGAKHLGVEHSRLIGSNFEEYLSPSETERFRKHRKKALSSNSTRTCHVEIASRRIGRLLPATAKHSRDGRPWDACLLHGDQRHDRTA